jgi:hypothetical protein
LIPFFINSWQHSFVKRARDQAQMTPVGRWRTRSAKRSTKSVSPDGRGADASLGEPATGGAEAKLPWLTGADNCTASALAAAGSPIGEGNRTEAALTPK